MARRTAARAEQQQQDRPAALGAGGSDGSGGKSSPVDHELIESALHEYDAYIELYKQRVEEGQKFAKVGAAEQWRPAVPCRRTLPPRRP